MHFSASEIIRAEIASRPGWVFTAAHLEHLNASQGNVERTLARLAEKGAIRRISQGLYHYPKKGKVISELPPKPEQVAKALTTGKGAVMIPSGATALHRLGLTTQVPMKYVYLTNRRSRLEHVGKLTVELKKVSPRHLTGAGTIAGEILSAIEYVGEKEALAPGFISKLARKLDESDLDKLNSAVSSRFAWVKKVVTQINETWRSQNELHTGSGST